MCSECTRRRDAFATALGHIRSDAVYRIATALTTACCQRRAQLVYRSAYDEWCRSYVCVFIGRQMMRIVGAEAAQLRLADFREEDRIAKELRMAGDDI
jgi:hypothetical protein